MGKGLFSFLTGTCSTGSDSTSEDCRNAIDTVERVHDIYKRTRGADSVGWKKSQYQQSLFHEQKEREKHGR